MSSDTGLYFAQFPTNFDKLRAVLVDDDDSHVGRESTRSWPGSRHFYREIIFTEPDLLIAPESEENVDSKRAVIIAENVVLESQKLQCTLQKFLLQQTTSIPLTKGLFIYCLQFVLSHRLAPLWNKINNYFVQGRDFLTEENKIRSIQAGFSLTDKITLAMKAQLVKLPKAKVEDFGVSPNVLERFHQSKDFVIHGHSLENNKCLVLPSLNTAYITGISRCNTADFDVKQYWKVMYGFRLPPSQPERDVFYDICFPMNSKIFTYPEYCIRQREPQVSVRCDQKAIFQSFLEDLSLRMPSVCGSPLTFTSSTLYATNSLHLASVAKQTNLTRAQTLSKANQPFAFTKKKHGISNAFNEDAGVSQNGVVTDAPRTKPYVPVFTKHKSICEHSKKKRFLKEGEELRKAKPLVPCFKKSGTKSKVSLNDLKISSSGLVKVVGGDGSDVAKTGSAKSTVDTSGSSNMVASRDRLNLCLNKTGTIFGGPSENAQQMLDSPVIAERTAQSLLEQNQSVKKQSTVPLKKKTKVPGDVVDVRKMVAENKLSKVSAPVIIKWLKSEGVKCKCKDKKKELMFKVYQHLGLVQPESSG